MDSVHSSSQANTAPSRSEQNHSECLWLPFPGEQEEGSHLVRTIRHKPRPGQAPGLLFGRTTALPCLSSPCRAAAGVNSHFKVLMKAPSASQTQGGNRVQRGVPSPVPGAGRRRGWGQTGHWEQPQQEGPLAPACSPPQLRRRQRGCGASAGGSARDCTLLKPEGFMRALAITTSICCAG